MSEEANREDGGSSSGSGSGEELHDCEEGLVAGGAYLNGESWLVEVDGWRLLLLYSRWMDDGIG